MARAVSVYQVLNKKRQLLHFDGKYKESFGTPELRGSWIIYGDSTHGKTTFVLQLCKYLTRFGRVLYNSLEEGDSESMKQAFLRVGMKEVARKFILLDNEPIEEFRVRLKKHKAPKIVVIDSLQYSGIKTPDEYKDLMKEFKNVLFIFISHANGKKADGKLAEKVRYDAMIKVRVEGFVAFVQTRYGGGKPFVIWEEGAKKYHALDIFE